jgi:hypothetical protein
MTSILVQPDEKFIKLFFKCFSYRYAFFHKFHSPQSKARNDKGDKYFIAMIF